MPNTLNQIIEDYKTEIKPYVESDLSDLNNLISGINISQNYLHRLRDIIKEKAFPTPEAEIFFFKVQKPLVYGHFKYFVKLHRYILEKPQGSISRITRPNLIKQRKAISPNLWRQDYCIEIKRGILKSVKFNLFFLLSLIDNTLQAYANRVVKYVPYTIISRQSIVSYNFI